MRSELDTACQFNNELSMEYYIMLQRYGTL